MNYLDSNILIYAVTDDHKYGLSCKKILENIQDKKIQVCSSLFVLTEIINVLVKINKIYLREHKTPINIEGCIDALLQLPILWYDLNFLLIQHASSYSLNISGGDYIHVATMELNSVFEIISADEDFDKVPFLKRIDPLKY